jgi:hypothetical protein
MPGGEADVVPEQEEAVAQVDGKAQVFGGGQNSASAIAMFSVVIEPDCSLWRTPTPSLYLCQPSLVEPLLVFICATGLMGKCFQRLFFRSAVIGYAVIIRSGQYCMIFR